MSRHEPMHVKPQHPMWWRVPYAVAVLFAVVGLIAVYDLNAHGNQSAWVGIVMSSLGALLWTWGGWQMKREYR